MFCCYSCYAKHYGSEFGALKMFKQFPPNKNKYPEILEYPYFWDTPRKSKDQTLSIVSRESLHGSSERPFFIWSWTFRDHNICMYITVHIYMYTYIYSITSIIYIYSNRYSYDIYIYIFIKNTYMLYIIYNLKIHKPVRCPHRLGSQTVIGGFQLLSLQGVQGSFLAVVKGCVCFQGK